MKRSVCKLLAIAFALVCAFTLFACDGGNKTDEEKNETYKVALNCYDVSLKTGETFTLVPKKFDGDGKEKPISEIVYSVEATGVASIDGNGVITAEQEGGTYINVNADGIEVACFVSVKNSVLADGLVILFSGKVYKGLSLQAYAFMYSNGVRIGVPESVIYSGGDESKATVTESGLVCGKEVCDDLEIYASAVYDGKTYTASKHISVVSPYYYVLSDPAIRLATVKTLSGDPNEAFTEKSGVTLSRINVLDDSDRSVIENVSVSVADGEIAEISADGQGVISVRSKETAGETVARVNAEGAETTVVVKIEIMTAIAAVEDMDVLGYASLLDPELLAGKYVLVGDIDYRGDVIFPIASYRLSSTASATRETGEQWKYRLNKTESGYAPVARADFGKKGQGLTDEQFAAFKVKGINPANTSFKGVFDGNGFGIKNAAIFFGSVLLVEGNLAVPEYAGIFGRLTGTLKNVSFENISIQDPADMIANGYNFCAAGKELRQSGGVYQYRGTSIVGSASGCEISNVYANINYNHKYIGNYSKAVLAVEMVNSCKVNNCVIESGGYTDFGYAVDSSLSSTDGALIKNCIAIGVNRFSKNVIDSSLIGVDGNYFLGTGKTWRDLAVITDADGLTAADSVSATFGACWDLSEFNSADGGRPFLIKGCSLS